MPVPSGEQYRVWCDSPDGFSTKRIQPIRHNFHHHPLMQLPELARLAKDLAATKQCRYIAPSSDQASAFNHGSEDFQGRAVDEVFRRIEEPGSWVALYNVETDPTYRAFLSEVTAVVRPLVEREEPGMFNVGGFIFVSAAPSVTPFHIDREHNFWLQVRGRKVINVWKPTDRHVVPAKDRDQFIVYGALKNVRLQEEFKERSHEFDVVAGDGVYFPSTSPHMTRCSAEWATEDRVSISIGVVFYTRATRRAANVHAVNLLLRRLGITPREPGESATIDRLKYPAGRMLMSAKEYLLGFKPKPGF
jgi:hypothetical protein